MRPTTEQRLIDAFHAQLGPAIREALECPLVVGDSAAQQAVTIGSQIVDRQLDVQPTITIRPGFRLNILVNKDMLFPEPYEGA